MSARFEVSIPEMENAAKTISQKAEEFLKAASETLQAADQLAQTWEGDSQKAFAEEQQKANEWYQKMVEIVKTYATSLQDAAKKYKEADEQSASDIKKR